MPEPSLRNLSIAGKKALLDHRKAATSALSRAVLLPEIWGQILSWWKLKFYMNVNSAKLIYIS